MDIAPSKVRIKAEEYSLNGHDSRRVGITSLGPARACEVQQDIVGAYGPLRQIQSPLHIKELGLHTLYLEEPTTKMISLRLSRQTGFQEQFPQFPNSAAQYNQSESVYASAWAQSDPAFERAEYASPVENYSGNTFSATEAAIADIITIVPSHVDPGIQPSSYVWDIPLKLMAPTCILDSILMTTIHQQRTLALSGASQPEICGPPTLNVLSLFDPQKSLLSHPVSRAWTDYATNMGYISSKPLADILAVSMAAYRLQRVCYILFHQFVINCSSGEFNPA